MTPPTYTLLIVEDFEADREQYKRYMFADSSCVYCLLEVESAAEGLELCRTRKIDAILLDYLLPDSDGLAFLESLSAQNNGDSVPVVMVTGEGHERIAVQAIKLGAADYLVKRDLTPKLLQSTISSAIKNAHLRRQLQQCKERFQTSIDYMLDGFGIYSSIRDEFGQIIDFRFDYLNAAALECNRMSVADIGRGLCEVFPSTRETGLFEEYCQVVETGQPLVKEDFIYLNVFGVQQLNRAYDVHVSKLDDGFVAIWRDVTVRKQVELKLQETNQQLTTTLESMTDAYVTLDREWRVIYTNQTATHVIFHLINLKPEAFLGKTYWELFPSLVGQVVEQEYRRAIAEQVAVHLEVLYEPTGDWFETHAYPCTQGLGIYFRNITDRKRAEAARTKFLATIEASLNEIYIFDADTLHFQHVNAGALNNLGYTSEKIQTMTPLDLKPEFDEVSFRELIAPLLRHEQEKLIFQTIHKRADGSNYPVEVHLQLIKYNQERIFLAVILDITQRKRTEAALKESEERFRTLADNMSQFAWMADADGWLFWYNRRWFEYTGTTLEEMQGWGWQQVHHPDHLDRVVERFRHSLETGNEWEDTFPLRGQDGTYRWFLSRAIPIADESGKILRWFGTNTDITDLKHAEESLRQSEFRCRHMADTAPVLIWMSGTDRLCYYFNQPWLDFTGRTMEQEIGNGWSAGIHPNDFQRYLDTYVTAFDVRQPFQIEYRLRRFDGVYRWFVNSGVPRFTSEGDFLGYIGSCVDIEDRKHAEQRLRESEERLRAGVEVGGVGLAKVDYATNLVELSPEAAALYGFPAKELVVSRKQIHATFHPDERTELLRLIEQSIDPQGTGWFAQDYRVVWPNGEVRWLSVRKQVFFDRSGEVPRPSYAIIAAIDITERRRTRDALEERNKELDSFVHIVSHDLKAPLRGISNLSQWIEEDLKETLPADAQQKIDLLRSRVHRMEAMIEGLLDYARVERADSTIEPVEVEELLFEVIDSIAPPSTFKIIISPDLPTLNTKRLLLSQVFANLIGNSIKHHDRPDGLIHVSGQDRGNFYEFVVSDDGPGIAPEYHNKIFMVFQTGKLQNSQNSSGIGLSIVKKIVEAQHGTIRLESQLEQGTTFYFTWPKQS
jgi:PAS domain S-box-containing protein